MTGRTKRMRRAGRPGFTLIELMLVMAVVALLVGILLPSLHRVRTQAYATATQARINQLAQGADLYYDDADSGNTYPGQRDVSLLVNTYTGSQILAACLFGYDYGNINDNNPVTSSLHAPLKDDDLITDEDGGRNNISDRFGAEPMPILYFPSRLGQTGLGQYVEDDNEGCGSNDEVLWFYNDPSHDVPRKDDNSSDSDFEKYIKDRRTDGNDSTTPFNPGKYLLIGAGIDRVYGTNDDLRNW